MVTPVQSPRISVLLPIYNGEKFLDEALQSLANQTFRDFEVIAINDHSTDNSTSIVHAWVEKDTRFRLFENTGPNGLPNALNFGLQHATGEFVARMDQDDICRPDRFAKEIDFLDRHSDIGLVGSGYQPFGLNKKLTPIYHPHRSTDIAWKFITNTRFAHPTVMLRRILIATVGHYPIQEAEDFGFFSQIVHSTPTANISSVLLDYREHGGNMSTVRRDIIQQAVRETYLRNYIYYIGTAKGATEFYQFHAGRSLPVRHLASVYRATWRILTNIQRTYQLKPLNIDWLHTVFLAHVDLARALLRSLLRLQSLGIDIAL